MPRPLIDIDANPRQPGFKPTKLRSKIPSPPKFQHAGSTGHRGPFSVSTTGSPCYTDMPPECESVASPTPTSKLPRKSTPTQSAFSKSYTYGTKPAKPRTSLPRARNWQEPAAIVVPPSSNLNRTTPPLSCDKPLPSPPIAQIVDSVSPLRAQRTLVDAEAGSPTEEVWPVLRPENVPPSKSLNLLTDSELPERSVPECLAFRRNDTSELRSYVTTPSINNRTPTQMNEWPVHEERMTHQRFRHSIEPRAFSPSNPYAESYHAFSIDANVAIHSPLAHKQQAIPAVAIPPRTSSKRSSLPSPDKAADETSTEPSASIRPAIPGCNKWPILAAADATAKARVIDRASENDQHHFNTEPKLAGPASFDGANVTQSQYGFIDSVSNRSLAAGSFLEDESEVNNEGTMRVKRLSWHSSNPNSGPTLRIHADADALILGRDESDPAVPTLPERMLREPSQEDSIGSPSERVSKQMLVDTVPIAGLRTSTPSSTEMATIGNRPVKITPIRSMQPPRKYSAGDLSKKSPTLRRSTSLDVVEAQEAPIAAHARSRDSFETSRASSVVQNKSNTIPSTSEVCSENDYAAGNYSTRLQHEVPQKALQMPSTETETLNSATRKCLPMTWTTPKSATISLKKRSATRSKTSPLLRSIERVSNRASAISTRSPSAASSGLAHSIPSQADSHQISSPRLGVKDLQAHNLDSTLHDNSSKGIHTDKQVAADHSRRTRAKRSFRNIFGTRDSKATLQPAERQESQHCPVADNALVKRIRNSTSISKVTLAKPPELKPELKHGTVVSLGIVEALATADPQAALSALESVPTEPTTQPMAAAQYDTATTIHSILDRVTSMGRDSPDRLRGLEIAEAVLHTVECSREANISAELARKHARDAELNVERVGLELKRLEKLCESDFDNETMQLIRRVIMSAGICVSNAKSID